MHIRLKILGPVNETCDTARNAIATAKKPVTPVRKSRRLWFNDLYWIEPMSTPLRDILEKLIFYLCDSEGWAIYTNERPQPQNTTFLSKCNLFFAFCEFIHASLLDKFVVVVLNRGDFVMPKYRSERIAAAGVDKPINQ